MVANILLSLLYAGAYIFSYVYYLHEYFEYLHFPLYAEADLGWFLPILFIAIPAAMMGKIKNAASVFSSFVYILIYVPTITTLQLAYEGGRVDLLIAQLTFLVSMVALLMVAKVNFTAAAPTTIKRGRLGEFLVAVGIISIGFIIASYRDNLSFVSLENVYSHRSENSDIGATGLISYVIAWTSAFVVPVLIAVGIQEKNNKYIALGCIASVVIYMAEASKGSLLMPIILYLLSLLISKFGVNNLYRSTMLVLSIVMIAGTLYVLKYSLSAPLTILVAIVIMRVVATGGILNTIYFEYFQSNPKTYLSQYGLFDGVFQTYPYKGEPVGYVIGREYVAEGMNVNANFWASDGLMNAGLPGVLVITFVLCIFFIILNKRSKDCPLNLVSLLILIFFSIAANASFFQALWSGGGIFMLFTFKYLKRSYENR